MTVICQLGPGKRILGECSDTGKHLYAVGERSRWILTKLERRNWAWHNYCPKDVLDDCGWHAMWAKVSQRIECLRAQLWYCHSKRLPDISYPTFSYQMFRTPRVSNLALTLTLALALTRNSNTNPNINFYPNSRYYLTLILLKNVRYETPGYEKVRVRNVRHGTRHNNSIPYSYIKTV